MAFRPIRWGLLALILCLVCGAPARACFGPKLFVAKGPGAENDVLYALVTLYIQEKTGVESTPVELEPDADPVRLITEDRADLVFAGETEAPDAVVFSVGPGTVLLAGKRPHEDLQFTTVLPALRKLEGLLEATHVQQLVEQVKGGDSPAAAARKFFMKRRWI